MFAAVTLTITASQWLESSYSRPAPSLPSEFKHFRGRLVASVSRWNAWNRCEDKLVLFPALPKALSWCLSQYYAA